VQISPSPVRCPFIPFLSSLLISFRTPLSSCPPLLSSALFARSTLSQHGFYSSDGRTSDRSYRHPLVLSSLLPLLLLRPRPGFLLRQARLHGRELCRFWLRVVLAFALRGIGLVLSLCSKTGVAKVRWWQRRLSRRRFTGQEQSVHIGSPESRSTAAQVSFRQGPTKTRKSTSTGLPSPANNCAVPVHHALGGLWFSSNGRRRPTLWPNRSPYSPQVGIFVLIVPMFLCSYEPKKPFYPEWNTL